MADRLNYRPLPRGESAKVPKCQSRCAGRWESTYSPGCGMCVGKVDGWMLQSGQRASDQIIRWRNTSDPPD